MAHAHHRSGLTGRWTAAGLALLTAVLLTAGLAGQGRAGSAVEVAALTPQPATVQPGLAVRYRFDRFEHIDTVISAFDRWGGESSDVLPGLDYGAGDGLVLTSDQTIYVGAIIEGVIHLEQAGAYEFMLLSNDGVRLEIGRQLVFEDPLIHSDTWSPALMVTAAEGGWHDFWLAYYQKKGTSALQLTWKRPGDTEFTVVPPVAFGHLASAE